MFVIKRPMIIGTPQDFTGEAQKAAEVMPFVLLAYFGWSRRPRPACSLQTCTTRFFHEKFQKLCDNNKDSLIDRGYKYTQR